jgi:hypothetical protein
MQLEIKDLTSAQEFNPKSKQIARSNEFINGRYHLTLLQSKILLLLCSQIQSGDEPGKIYTIPVSEVLRGTKSNNYQYVVSQARSLQGKTIEVRGQQKNGRQYYDSVNLFYKVSYTKERSGNIYFIIHPDLKPHFLDLKEYSKYLIDYVVGFKNEHSLRVYELLKEYWNKGQKKRTFTLEDFKALLGIPDKYNTVNASGKKRHDWKNFRRRLLLKVQQDFERCADIVFEIEPLLRGKLTVGFTLQISPNERKFVLPAAKGKYKNKLIKTELIDKLKQNYAPDLVEFTLHKALSDGSIRNPEGWLVNALQEGYFVDEFEQTNKKLIKRQQAKEESVQQQLFEANLEEIRTEYDKFWKSRCLYYFDKHQNELDKYLDAFRTHYRNDPKLKQTIEEIEKNVPSEMTKRKLGNFILQLKGRVEEKDWKAFAKVKFDIIVDD